MIDNVLCVFVQIFWAHLWHINNHMVSADVNVDSQEQSCHDEDQSDEAVA